MRKSQKNKKTASEFQSVYTVTNAVKRGSVVTRLSMIIMGLGNIAHKQIGKGLLFLLGEVIYIAYMALAGRFGAGHAAFTGRSGAAGSME